jgi:predicted  nucleic acid-binding Zn-ribbon protein
VDVAQDATEGEPETSRDKSRYTAQEERVEDLREQVSYLRWQLDEEREARRRADTILVQLSAANAEQARTIRALEAPSEPAEEAPEDAETVEEAPEGYREPGPTPRARRRAERARGHARGGVG